MGAVRLPELGSDSFPKATTQSNVGLHEKQLPDADGASITDLNALPASTGSMEPQKSEEHIDSKASAPPQAMNDMVSTEMEEQSKLGPITYTADSLTSEEPIGVVVDEVAAEGDGSGRTDSLQSGGEGVGYGWISAETGVLVAEPAPVPDLTPPPIRRRTYYLVRIPRFVDNKLKNEIRLAELHFEETNKKRDFLRAAVQLKRASKMELLEKLRPVRDKERVCREAIHAKLIQMEPFQQTLKKFRTADGMGREKGLELCSSEEELNHRIAYLQHRIQHESIPLKEEKQLVREIKLLEATRSQVCANTALQANMVENFGPRADSQEQCRLLGLELDALRKEHKQVRAEYEVIEKEVDAINKEIEDLLQQMNRANGAQHEAFVALKELKRQESLQNDEFYQNKRDMQAAKQLAFQKKYEALEELCQGQVEHILGLWNNAGFRASYVQNNERSTLKRLGTFDGRSLGPDEEPPLLISGADASAQLLHRSEEIVPGLGAQTTAFSVGATRNFKVPSVKPKLLTKVVMATSQVSLPEINTLLDFENSEERNAEVALSTKLPVPSTTTGKPSSAPQTDAVDDIAKQEIEASELKEKRRQEEMAKAKEAAERKKRQAERAQAKAHIRAKKEAERRQKEREKKAWKKSVAEENAAVATETSPVASEGDAREVVATKVGNSISDPVKGTPEASRVTAVKHRKPLGKKLKALKPGAGKPFTNTKKVTSSFPLWLWAVLAVLVLVVIVRFQASMFMSVASSSENLKS